MIDPRTPYIAMAGFIAVIFALSTCQAMAQAEQRSNQPTYQQGINCAEKKQGSRPACWTTNDWQAYCQNTGNCRNHRR